MISLLLSKTVPHATFRTNYSLGREKKKKKGSPMSLPKIWRGVAEFSLVMTRFGESSCSSNEILIEPITKCDDCKMQSVYSRVELPLDINPSYPA